MDLFVSPLTYPASCPVPGPRSRGGGHSEDLVAPGLLYASPPLPLILAIIRKVLLEGAEMVLVAPHWPRRPWFADLVSLSVTRPWRIPPDRVSLSQGPVQHPDPQSLQLAVWPLSGKS